MIIVTQVSYPTTSTREMASRFLEAPALPDYIKRYGPYIDATLADGIKTLSFNELDESKLAQAMKDIGNYMATFFGVDGFKYEIKPYYKVEEALRMVGMG